MERREFIKSSCITCAGGLGLSWILTACSSPLYVSNFVLNESKLTIKKSEFQVVQKGKNSIKKFMLIKPENFQFPIAVYQLNNNEYKSLSLQCTHQGCELTAYETTMVCPCHGAEFNTKGEVTQGPAETNLKTFITTHDDENIYIQL